jgi:hypothetical protein
MFFSKHLNKKQRRNFSKINIHTIKKRSGWNAFLFNYIYTGGGFVGIDVGRLGSFGNSASMIPDGNGLTSIISSPPLISLICVVVSICRSVLMCNSFFMYVSILR